MNRAARLLEGAHVVALRVARTGTLRGDWVRPDEFPIACQDATEISDRRSTLLLTRVADLLRPRFLGSGGNPGTVDLPSRQSRIDSADGCSDQLMSFWGSRPRTTMLGGRRAGRSPALPPRSSPQSRMAGSIVPNSSKPPRWTPQHDDRISLVDANDEWPDEVQGASASRCQALACQPGDV